MKADTTPARCNNSQGDETTSASERQVWSTAGTTRGGRTRGAPVQASGGPSPRTARAAARGAAGGCRTAAGGHSIRGRLGAPLPSTWGPVSALRLGTAGVSIIQLINQSITQSINYSIHQLLNPSINQLLNQPITQSVRQYVPISQEGSQIVQQYQSTRRAKAQTIHIRHIYRTSSVLFLT